MHHIIPETAILDPTDIGTLRLLAKLLNKKGAQFKLIDIDNFAFKVHLPKNCSLDDLITLFTQYYNEDIINTIPQSRVKDWYDTYRSEIYLYLAVFVVPTFLKQLSKATYHVYFNNLFTFTQLFEYLRSNGFVVTSTCRKFSGVYENIVHLKETREKVAILTELENDGKTKVLRVRKRLKKTAGNTKISRAPFKDQPTKELRQNTPDLRKRRISHLSKATLKVPVHLDCIACKRGKFGDSPPRKRVALGDIASNIGRTTKRKATIYGCK
ncbi:hypothetical protein DL98DRAFT_522892 [Cadophora sp. DSE1049]|nr:hypothetical protein DL98DRAFT_522892 [Cadophora sp. DSE1049]